MSNRIIIPSEMVPMKTIELKDKATAKAYLTRDPKDTHTKEEMESLLRAIAFTKMFHQQESLEKMNEEEMVTRHLPGT